MKTTNDDLAALKASTARLNSSIAEFNACLKLNNMIENAVKFDVKSIINNGE